MDLQAVDAIATIDRLITLSVLCSIQAAPYQIVKLPSIVDDICTNSRQYHTPSIDLITRICPHLLPSGSKCPLCLQHTAIHLFTQRIICARIYIGRSRLVIHA